MSENPTSSAENAAPVVPESSAIPSAPGGDVAGQVPSAVEAAVPAVAEVAEVTEVAETPPEAAAEPAPAVVPTAELSPAACAQRLGELFPAVFAAGTHLPLKLRIQADIQQRAPGVFTKKSLSLFLHRYTTTTAYLKALVNAPSRIDLDGGEAGPVSDEHKAAAQTELQRRRAIFEERRAAERATQRQAQDAERRQRQVEDQALNERASLLRAFETTTLTLKNFCALRNLSEDELEATLAQARQERAQRPPRPGPASAGRPDGRRDEPRGPGGERRGGGRGRPDRAGAGPGRGPRPAQEARRDDGAARPAGHQRAPRSGKPSA